MWLGGQTSVQPAGYDFFDHRAQKRFATTRGRCIVEQSSKLL